MLYQFRQNDHSLLTQTYIYVYLCKQKLLYDVRSISFLGLYGTVLLETSLQKILQYFTFCFVVSEMKCILAAFTLSCLLHEPEH